MNIRHFFDNIDEKTIDRITEKYPPLSSDDKERLYAMSKKKYNRAKNENSSNAIEVSGVERYRKPVWHKVMSAVAAAVVVLGGIGGTLALIRRNNDADILKNESSQLAEIKDIAQQLTDEFFDLKNIISSRGAAYDENDTLTYKIGIFDDALENPDQYTYERIFFKVTDERFSNAQDIYDALKNITSSTYFSEERYENAIITWEIIYDYVNEETVYPKLFYNLGTDVSMFENGSEVGREYFLDAEGNPMEESPIDFEDDFDWEAPRSIWMADYVEYNGSLYMLTPDYVHDPVGVVYDYNEKIEITDVTNDSFTVIRYADISHNENIIKRAEFKFVRENGEWCIDNFFECVLDTEGVGSEETDYNVIAQQLSDKLLEFENIINYGNVSYDENDSISFTVINSEDMEWTEKYSNVATFYKVTDPRFTCRQDVYNEVRSFFSSCCYRKDYFYMQNFLGYTLECCLGNDLSKYENGGTIDLAVNGHNDMEHIYLFCFCEYNGELYVRQHYSELSEYTSDVIIKETGENSFTATRSYTEHYTEDITSEKCFDFVLEAGKWKIDKVYLAGEESEGGYDYTAIATELTDKLLEMENTICYGDISYDEYDRTVIDIVCSDDSAQFEPPCEVILYKVTDPRFTCRRDLYDELRSIYTKQRYDEDDFSTATIFGFDLNFYLGSELSDYIKDGKIDLAENNDDDYEHINLAVYGDINGELYVRQCDFELSEYTSDVIIKETGENSFTAIRSYRGDFVIGDGTSNRCFDFVLENGEWKIDKVYFSDEESEDVTESKDEYDYTAIAQQLFDDYLEVARIIRWGDVSYDENDSITFYTYNSNDAEWSDNNVGERTFYKVTDERFSSCQDIYEMLRAITTTECEPEENFMNADWFDQINLSSSLGGDVSMFEIGENIDINHEISDWRWPGYSINRSVFVEYNGELYVNRRYNETPVFTSDVIIKETGENSFTTTRKYKSPVNSVEEYCILEVVLENGEWKINHMLNN